MMLMKAPINGRSDDECYCHRVEEKEQSGRSSSDVAVAASATRPYEVTWPTLQQRACYKTKLLGFVSATQAYE